jgi:hypothetical protein
MDAAESVLLQISNLVHGAVPDYPRAEPTTAISA